MDDHTLVSAIEEFEDDLALAETADAMERQLAFQEQLGGSATAHEPGCFEFVINPFVDRLTETLGVHERVYTTQLQQRGHFIPRQNLNRSLKESMETSLQRSLY